MYKFAKLISPFVLLNTHAHIQREKDTHIPVVISDSQKRRRKKEISEKIVTVHFTQSIFLCIDDYNRGVSFKKKK